jgi:hypothetical protein
MAGLVSARFCRRARVQGARLAGLWLSALLLIPAAPSRAAEGSPAASFRVFFVDGSSSPSYGECARTGDRVVFSLALGPADTPSNLRLIDLPASSVDWARTSRYTEAVRSAHYAASRGEADYAALTAEVARVLTELSITAEPLRRLTMAVQMRRYLLEWPGRHYGYRAADVQELVSVLEESVSSAKASAGHDSFDLSLVAMPAGKAPALVPAPTLEESLKAAATSARLSDVPAERVSLRQAILRVLDQHRNEVDDRLRRELERTLTPQVEAGLWEEQQYGRLRARAMKDASSRAAQGDVRGVERVIDDIRKRDAALGRRRPLEVLALDSAVAGLLDKARAQRLALDQYALRSETFREYRRALDVIFKAVGSLGREVEAVKAMAGPKPAAIPRLIGQLKEAAERLTMQRPPAQLEDTHAVLQSAVHLMSEGFRMRHEAVLANDVQLAQNASSAAAGSLLLLQRARSDIDTFFSPPALR